MDDGPILLEALIRSALRFQASFMAEPHASYDWQLELDGEIFDRAVVAYAGYLLRPNLPMGVDLVTLYDALHRYR